MTITAVANVQRLRTKRSLRYLGFVRCNIAAMTMAASAGCGIFRNRGVSRMSVKKQKAAAIRSATWLRAPAAMATEVFDRLPTTRNPPKRPLKMFAGPCASNSWFGLMSLPLCIAAAFETVRAAAEAAQGSSGRARPNAEEDREGGSEGRSRAGALFGPAAHGYQGPATASAGKGEGDVGRLHRC